MQTLETPLKRSAAADVSYWTCWTKWFCFNNIALFTTRTKDFARFPRVTIRRKVRNSTHWHPQKRWKKKDGKIRNPMHHFAEFWLFLNASALLPFFPGIWAISFHLRSPPLLCLGQMIDLSFDFFDLLAEKTVRCLSCWRRMHSLGIWDLKKMPIESTGYD